jgi:hypothetical protein
MAYLDFDSGSRFFAHKPAEPEIKIAASVALEIAEKAAELQKRFLAKVGLTLRQAQRLSDAEKERLQRRYTEFLLG